MSIHIVSHRTDELVRHASRVLQRRGAMSHHLACDEVTDPLLMEQPEVQFIALFSSPGIYPSRHYRIVQERDLTNRKFVLPPWIPRWGTYEPARLVCVALRAVPDALVDQHGTDPKFEQAMNDLYRRISGQADPGRDARSSQKKRKDSLTRRRERVRDELRATGSWT